METMGKVSVKTEEQKAKEFERLKDWVKKIIKDDADRFDLKAEADMSLSYEENKSQLREKLKPFVKDLDELHKKTKAAQEQFEQERILNSEKEAEEYNKSLKFVENKELDGYYARIRQSIDKMCKGYCNLVFIKGPGAIGKSFNIRKALTENKAEYLEISGDVSEAYLYRLIYENNGKIIWLKEVVKLLANNGLNLLKSATETEQNKVLTKSNYSKQQADLPDMFLCRCKFIFDYNNIPSSQMKTDFQALATRGDYIELSFSDEDLKNMLRCVAKNDPVKAEITEYIIQKYEENNVVQLNLRTQYKAFQTYEYAKYTNQDWHKLLDVELDKVSKVRALLYSVIGNRAVRTADLKRELIRREVSPTLRTASNMVRDWLFLGELNKWSEGDKNFLVCINPRKGQPKNDSEEIEFE